MRAFQLISSVCLGLAAAASVAGTSLAQDLSLRWTRYITARGTSADIPASLFARDDGPSHIGSGRQFATADGRAHLAIYTLPNRDGESPTAFLRRNYRESPSVLHYAKVTPTYFVVSKNEGDTILYKRCNFSFGAGSIHCINLAYPRAEKRAWDAIVSRISLSLRPLDRALVAGGR